ncbi:MAG: hydroxylamine reductase [Firmicutes bacterium]|nr:hydroxylamine reductase [Bacillota bacterium]
MFCYQCEQRAANGGCRVMGVCGKDSQTAALQDLLIHASQGISMYAHRARALGASDREIDLFIVEALFTTVTNVNFDPERLAGLVRRAAQLRDKARNMYIRALATSSVTSDAGLGATPGATSGHPAQAFQSAADLGGPAAFAPADDLAGLVKQGEEVGAAWVARSAAVGSDAAGVADLALFGLKGMAAYADHAQILGVEDAEVYGFFHEAMDFLAGDRFTLDEALAVSLRVGEVNIKVMAMLDKANTTTYGNPAPTRVRVTPVKGRAILVSGHDLADLEAILQQTEGKGINVYTHGEMLPCHGYPRLRKYPHLVGNYGGAWQDQRREFAEFPGAIVMTTNCIQRPQDSYRHRIFTTGLVAWPGVRHIAGRDFSPAIDAALAEPGFSEDGPDHYITVGFGHNAVMSVAGQVIDAVKAGKIRHFFLIGGCDGAKSGRNYYTELAQRVPDDCVILTLACGKYRFNKLDFGEVAGIPRLLDVGQCNDAYSAVVIAMELAKAFGTDINGLPLSLVLSWYEQKAVCILLSLLHLKVRNIRLGPTLPEFLTPSVVEVLQERFNIMPITTVDEDLAAILGQA